MYCQLFEFFVIYTALAFFVMMSLSTLIRMVTRGSNLEDEILVKKRMRNNRLIISAIGLIFAIILALIIYNPDILANLSGEIVWDYQQFLENISEYWFWYVIGTLFGFGTLGSVVFSSAMSSRRHDD